VLGDASRDELDPDAPHIRALELFSVRAGLAMMSLSVRGVTGIADALRAQRPDLVVIAGGQMSNDGVATWVRSVRLAVGPTPITLYRRGDHLAGSLSTGTTLLPTRASDAHYRLIELVKTERAPASLPTFPTARSNAVTTQRRADSPLTPA
jgi:MerR family transcriptional regulator, light-induced transcriptional regulator